MAMLDRHHQRVKKALKEADDIFKKETNIFLLKKGISP